MNKKKRWLTRIKRFHNEVENQQPDLSDNDIPPFKPAPHYWRVLFTGALFGVGATLLILGVNKLSTENLELKARVSELETSLKKASRQSAGFDLYTMLPDPLPAKLTTAPDGSEPVRFESWDDSPI